MAGKKWNKKKPKSKPKGKGKKSAKKQTSSAHLTEKDHDVLSGLFTQGLHLLRQAFPNAADRALGVAHMLVSRKAAAKKYVWPLHQQ